MPPTKRVLSLLFFLGIAVRVYSQKCPENIRPCTCHEDGLQIYIYCRSDSNTGDIDLKYVLSSVGKSPVYLSLNGLRLGNISSNCFAKNDVRGIIISNCELDGLAEEDKLPFVGLEDSLESLTVSNSLDENDDLTKLKFGHLKKLGRFFFGSNRIKRVGNWFEEGPAALEQIFLHNNGIQELGEKAFAGLRNLQFLHLRRNQISTLERGMFSPSAIHLLDLILGNNALSDLPEDIFSNMPALSHVDLSSNQFEKLQREVWEPVWEQLHTVNLNDNPLMCDSEMKWMFDLRTPPTLYGICKAPAAMKGKRVAEFIERKGEK